MPDFAEYRFKTVVSGQSSITCLLPGVDAEAVLDGNLAVVKDNPFGNTAEILKYLNQRIQKALLILPAVCQNHGAPL